MTPQFVTSQAKPAVMPLDLSEIATEDLVHEVQRRLECLDKPEKRLILIGAKQPGTMLGFGAARSYGLLGRPASLLPPARGGGRGGVRD